MAAFSDIVTGSGAPVFLRADSSDNDIQTLLTQCRQLLSISRRLRAESRLLQAESHLIRAKSHCVRLEAASTRISARTDVERVRRMTTGPFKICSKDIVRRLSEPPVVPDCAARQMKNGDLADGLTKREIDVLKWVAEGRSTKEIAAILGVSFKTASCHRTHAMKKLGIHDAVSLARYAYRKGWVNL